MITDIVENSLQIQTEITTTSLTPVFLKCNCSVINKSFKNSVKISSWKMNDRDEIKENLQRFEEMNFFIKQTQM